VTPKVGLAQFIEVAVLELILCLLCAVCLLNCMQLPDLTDLDLPSNVVAASIVLRYWTGGNVVPIAAWLTIFNVAILVVNFLGIRFFGEFEFWLSTIKVITLVGLLIMSICLTSGANPAGDVIWFRYWGGDSGPFASYKVGGSKGAFLGVWACMGEPSRR